MSTSESGRGMTPIERVMSERVVMVLDRLPMSEVRTIANQHDYNGFPVVNAEGRLVGMITKGDLLRTVAAGLEDPDAWRQPASRWMAKGVLALRPTDPVERALEGMIDNGLRSLPVINGEDRVVGIVSRNDVMAAMDGRAAR